MSEFFVVIGILFLAAFCLSAVTQHPGSESELAEESKRQAIQDDGGISQGWGG